MTVHASNDLPDRIDPALEKARHARRLMSLAGFDEPDVKDVALTGARAMSGFVSQHVDHDGARVSRELAREARAEGRSADAEIHYLDALRRDQNTPESAALALSALHLQSGDVDPGARRLVRAAEESDSRASAASQLAVMAQDGNHRPVAMALLVYAVSAVPDPFARDLDRIVQLPLRKLIRHSKEETDGLKLFMSACRLHVEGKAKEAYYLYHGASERDHPLAKLGVVALSRWVLPGQIKEFGRGPSSLTPECVSVAASWLVEQREKLVESARQEPPVPAIGPAAGTSDRPASDVDLDRLVTESADGDRTATNRILAIIRPLVVRYCRARVGNPVDRSTLSADDIAQEVCLAVLTALPGYHHQGRSFLAFVYGIAQHKVIDAHRSIARQRAELTAAVPEEVAVDAGPEELAISKLESASMGRMLHTLPPKQREILVLRVVVGLSAEETAEAIGVTPGAVRVAQHRALSKLRTMLCLEIDSLSRAADRAPRRDAAGDGEHGPARAARTRA